jgi:hypothetical protein
VAIGKPFVLDFVAKLRLGAYLPPMDILDIAAAIFIGNALSFVFAWGAWNFHKHDEAAPFMAYFAFLFPIAFALVSLYLTGLTPPQFDALTSQ